MLITGNKKGNINAAYSGSILEAGAQISSKLVWKSVRYGGKQKSAIPPHSYQAMQVNVPGIKILSRLKPCLPLL